MARAPLALALALALTAACGCVAPILAEEVDAPPETWEAADLWRGAVDEGERVTVTPLVVTSPRDRDGVAFYAAAPGGGAWSGVRVVLGQVIDDWPLPVGSAFEATGTLVQARPPVLWVAAEPDFVRIEGDPAPVEPVDLGDVPLEGRDRLDLRFALVTARDVTVTSVPDPLGHADSTGPPLGGRFAVTPGYGRTGDVTGILGEDLRVSARTVEDWTGELHSDLPLEGATLDKLDGIPAGTPLVLRDLVLATPWSRDLRWAVVQDAEGHGAWVDAEGWGLWRRVGRGQRGQWTVEVRYDEDGPYLRTWIAPLVRDRGTILGGKELVDGAIVWFAATELGPADAYGERWAGEVLLDDRFADLSAVPEGAAVAGVGAVRGGDIAPLWVEVR